MLGAPALPPGSNGGPHPARRQGTGGLPVGVLAGPARTAPSPAAATRNTPQGRARSSGAAAASPAPSGHPGNETRPSSGRTAAPAAAGGLLARSIAPDSPPHAEALDALGISRRDGGGGDSGGGGGGGDTSKLRTTTELLNDVDELVELLEERIVAQLERRGLRFRDLF
ncbi:MAG: hypothetical protein IT196_20450 [Acidimicrobiales bacterium]|nr:hypothetical protein [Acidimicrobiales bacterium]